MSEEKHASRLVGEGIGERASDWYGSRVQIQCGELPKSFTSLFGGLGLV